MLAFCRSVRGGVSWGGNSGCVLRGGAGPASGFPGDHPRGVDPLLHVDGVRRDIRTPISRSGKRFGRHCHVGGAGGRIRWVSNVSTVSYKGHRFPMEIINHCVWLYFRFPLSFREVEEMMLARGVAVSHETIRRWCAKFGQAYANELRRRRPRPGAKWHLDEVFIKIRGVQRYLWRAVDEHGVVLDVLVTSRRNAAAARRFLRKLLKGLCYVPKRLITDKLASYPVAHRELMGLGETSPVTVSEQSCGELSSTHPPAGTGDETVHLDTSCPTLPVRPWPHLRAFSTTTPSTQCHRVANPDDRPIRSMARCRHTRHRCLIRTPPQHDSGKHARTRLGCNTFRIM